MFDENGERFRRRSTDGWRIAPLLVAPSLGLLAWGISVETRLNAISLIQAERGPQISKMSTAISELLVKASDPSTKPETQKAIKQLWEDHDRLSSRIDRLDERFNNFHQFLLQTRPQTFPLGRRGSAPFTLDDRG